MIKVSGRVARFAIVLRFREDGPPARWEDRTAGGRYSRSDLAMRERKLPMTLWGVATDMLRVPVNSGGSPDSLRLSSVDRRA